MRKVLIATLTAAGIGLVATAGAPAAPVNGSVISEAATAESLIQEAAVIRHTRRVCARWVSQWRHLPNTRRVQVRRCVRWRHL